MWNEKKQKCSRKDIEFAKVGVGGRLQQSTKLKSKKIRIKCWD